MKIIKKLFKNEIILYLMAGSVTTVVNWCTYAAMVSTEIKPTIANAIAWTVGVIVAFMLNKKLVFKSNDVDWMKEFLSFSATRVITGIFEIIGFPLLLLIPVMKTSFLSIEVGYAKITITIVVTILNYIFGKIVFQKKTGEKIWRKLN